LPITEGNATEWEGKKGEEREGRGKRNGEGSRIEEGVFASLTLYRGIDAPCS